MKGNMKKVRNPGKFGVSNEVAEFGFKVDKEDGVVLFLKDRSYDDDSDLWLEPKTARWLAEKLKKAADYLEQEGF